MNAHAQENQQIVPAAPTPAPNNVGQNVVALIPQDFDTAWRFATVIVKAGVAPKDMGTAEKAFAAVLMGAEVGLSPMQAMQNIAVVNGRTAIWGDAQLGLVEASGKLADFGESYAGNEGVDDFKAICRAVRVGRATEIVREFSIADAKKAGLWGKAGPWSNHPKRMLQMRARAFALRDGFSDVLKGLYSREELIGEPLDVPLNPNIATAAELNETYLTNSSSDASAKHLRPTIEHEPELSGANTEQEAPKKPSPKELVDKAHAELEAQETEKKTEPLPARPVVVLLASNTNYGIMTADQMKQAARQAIGDLAEYAGDPEALAGYWASINGKALVFALGRKGLSAEKAKLEAIVPAATKLTSSV